MSERKGITILRVGDGLYYRNSRGEWSSENYYQYAEILESFERAGVKVQLRAFGRIVESEQKGLYLYDHAGFIPCGFAVRGRGLWELARNYRRCRAAMRAEIAAADLVWAMLPSMLGILALRLARQSKPLVSQLVGDPSVSLKHAKGLLYGHLASAITAHLVRGAIAKSDGAIFVSEALKRKYWQGSPDSACVANESRLPGSWLCDSTRLTPRTRGQASRLLFMGRLSAEKGLAVLLHALARCPGVSLTVIGDGPQRNELVALCSALGLGTRVQFAGHRRWGRELIEGIRQFDALVLPSYAEGLGLVLAEAMSQGVPVIASRVGGIPDIVRDGENGLLVPPGDPIALANAIRQVAEDISLSCKLALGAIATAEHHTTEVQYGGAARFILGVLDSRRPSGASCSSFVADGPTRSVQTPAARRDKTGLASE